ncbi:MAG: hypothetical protein H6895_03250 [Defluviimonas sp.]|uniref:hypothetical protein n=1 Tax=Albidovulum sp. TaxID=1872424 RepID=UPI002A25C8C5|nr:hypothetical protein [Defluviimonas sp.]
MIRISLLLCFIMLVYVALAKKDEPVAQKATPQQIAASIRAVLNASHIGAPDMLPASEVTFAPPAESSPPPPFDLSQTTGAEPARLRAAASADRTLPVTEGSHWRVTSEIAPVHAGPGDAYTVLTALNRGDIVVGQPTGNAKWLWVRTADTSLAGYVATDTMQPVEDQ